MPLIKLLFPFAPEEVQVLLERFSTQISWVIDPRYWWVLVLMYLAIYIGIGEAQKRISSLPYLLNEAKGDALKIIIGVLLIGPRLPLYWLLWKWLKWGYTKAQDEIRTKKHREERKIASKQRGPKEPNPQENEEENSEVPGSF